MPAFRAELHVHTVLSPCAGVEMIPPIIVQRALAKSISLLGVTDHNTTANAGAVMEAARGTSLNVLPGMELQTREEIHVLCLFDTLEQAAAWQTQVDTHYPNLRNNPERLGEQYVVDATGKFIRHETRLLIVSAELSLSETLAGVNALGGLCIPAHVDRRAYGLMHVLGFAAPEFEALEISPHISVANARRQYPQIAGFALVQNGDVHFPDDFLGSTIFEMEAPTIAELRLALRQQQGRRFRVENR